MFEASRSTKGSFYCGSSVDAAKAWSAARIAGAGTPVVLTIVAFPAGDRSLVVHGSPPLTVSIYLRPRLPSVSRLAI